MERKVSVPLYVTAFALSLVIFVIGVFVGMAIDMSFTDELSHDVESIGTRLSSVELFLLLEDESVSFCPVYRSELESINVEVENIGHRLSYLEDEKNVYDDELKKDYFVLEAQSYLLSKRMKQTCGDESMLLLYFYSNKGCEECREQGIEILRFRDSSSENDTIKIYSFDGELGSPIVDAFKEQYSVEEYPTIIIDGEKLEGFSSAEEIQGFVEAIE